MSVYLLIPVNENRCTSCTGIRTSTGQFHRTFPPHIIPPDITPVKPFPDGKFSQTSLYGLFSPDFCPIKNSSLSADNFPGHSPSEHHGPSITAHHGPSITSHDVWYNKSSTVHSYFFSTSFVLGVNPILYYTRSSVCVSRVKLAFHAPETLQWVMKQ